MNHENAAAAAAGGVGRLEQPQLLLGERQRAPTVGAQHAPLVGSAAEAAAGVEASGLIEALEARVAGDGRAAPAALSSQDEQGEPGLEAAAAVVGLRRFVVRQGGVEDMLPLLGVGARAQPIGEPRGLVEAVAILAAGADEREVRVHLRVFFPPENAFHVELARKDQELDDARGVDHGAHLRNRNLVGDHVRRTEALEGAAKDGEILVGDAGPQRPSRRTLPAEAGSAHEEKPARPRPAVPRHSLQERIEHGRLAARVAMAKKLEQQEPGGLGRGGLHGVIPAGRRPCRRRRRSGAGAP